MAEHMVVVDLHPDESPWEVLADENLVYQRGNSYYAHMKTTCLDGLIPLGEVWHS